jgi:hypothetical protein
VPMGQSDAFDVITDEELTGRTTNLKRNFALLLAAQNVNDAWYAFDDPAKLAAAIKDGSFNPADDITRKLLEYSGSIDAKTLDVFRDVGVGAPQVGMVGAGVPQAQEQPVATNGATRRGVFRP